MSGAMSGGRPTKYTDELAAAICKDIERGNTFRTAALVNGIAESTFHLWREKFSEFSERTSIAEAKAEANVVSSLGYLVEKSDFNAIKFYLTHRNNDGWRPPKQTNEHSGPDGGPIQTKVVVERVSFDDSDASTDPR
jgi:hypothetical protein